MRPLHSEPDEQRAKVEALQAKSDPSQASADQPQANIDEQLARDEYLLTKAHLQTIFDTLDISLWSEEFPSRRMSYVSPGSERVWGIPLEELIAEPTAPYRLIHPDDLDAALGKMDVVDEGDTVVHDFRITRPDGQVRWIHDQVTPILDEHGELVRLTGVSVDVTEIKLAEEERAKTREFLQRSEQLSALGQLAAGIAHEIRNPLASVMGFLQLTRPLIPDQSQYVDIMMSELRRINEIIGEFLMLAKPQNLKMEAHDLRSIVAEITSFLHGQAMMHDILFVTDVDATVPPILCDKSQMKQVLINLIKNAMEAMPQGGTITIAITHHAKNEVLIQIADEGCGISLEDAAKVGQPFFTTKEGGTGLGMMVTRQLIENHGGRMRVDSEIDKGTTISVILPNTP